MVSALQVRTGWLVRAEMSTATLPTVPAAALSNTKGLNEFIMCSIQNYCSVKVLGVSQIIQENPEIINKTDS